jgi:hypothetical protein
MSRRVFAWVLALSQLPVVGCGERGTQAIPQEPIAVAISPTSANMLVSAPTRFSAAVRGTPQTGVLFVVLEGSRGGVVRADGTYVAPPIPGTYHVRASSDADPRVHADAVVTVHDYREKMLRTPDPSDGYEYHTITLLPDGSALVVGGIGFAGVHRQTERYVPGEGRFKPGPALITPRMQHAALLLADGKLLVTGGVDTTLPGTGFDAAFQSTEIYDPATAVFRAGPEMWFPRRHHVMTLLEDGRVLVTGGIQLRGDGFGATGNTEIYDPAANQFVIGHRLVESGRWLHTATLLFDWRVLIAGGRSNNCTARCPVFSLNTAEIFDPSSGTFTPTGSLTIGRFGHSSALLPDGRVMILGGTTADATNGIVDQVRTAEVCDPALGQFSVFGFTSLGRGFHALVPLNNGKYLLAGGNGQNGLPTSTTEIFDPVTRTSTEGPEMSEYRIRATTLRLQSGEVLIVRGNNSGGPAKPVDLFQ